MGNFFFFSKWQNKEVAGGSHGYACKYGPMRILVQCLRGVLCAWHVREVSLQIIHKGPLGKHNNQGGRLVPRQ